MGTTKAYRVMHKFWLDITREGEYWLDEQIAELKKRRQFVTTVRDALRLLLDLRSGSTTVLMEMFPHLRTTLTQTTKGGEGDPEIKSMLEMLLKQQTAGGYLMQSGKTPPTTMGPKPLTTRSLSLPRFDDDDTLVITKSQGSSSIMNFVSVMKELQ